MSRETRQPVVSLQATHTPSDREASVAIVLAKKLPEHTGVCRALGRFWRLKFTDPAFDVKCQVGVSVDHQASWAFSHFSHSRVERVLTSGVVLQELQSAHRQRATGVGAWLAWLVGTKQLPDFLDEARFESYYKQLLLNVPVQQREMWSVNQVSSATEPPVYPCLPSAQHSSAQSFGVAALGPPEAAPHA